MVFVPDELYLAAEILRESSPVDPEADASTFNILLCNFSVSCLAGSSFEVTLKASVVFYRLGLLTENCRAVCRSAQEDDNNGLFWSYDVNSLDGYPRVILHSLFKKSQVSDTSHENAELLAVPRALNRVFGFDSFRAQQRERL